MLQSNSQSEIENKIVNREIARIQRIVEGQNLEIKKTLSRYNLLVERQREIVSRRRDKLLRDDSHVTFFQSNCPDQYNALSETVGREKTARICREFSLFFIDKTWSQYLDDIADIRESIHLVRLGRQDPLFAFNKRIIYLFENLQGAMASLMVKAFNAVRVEKSDLDMDDMSPKAPSSTWTYLINDDPFKNIPWLEINRMPAISPEGMAFLLIYTFLKRLFQRKAK